MNYCLRARIWRVMLLAATLIAVALPLNACATTPGATAKSLEPWRDVTTAYISQGDLWVTLRGAHTQQLTHLTTAVTWSKLYWSPDATQIAATFDDDQATPAQSSLVIANILTNTVTITPQAIYSHADLAGWIAADTLLLVGDDATPGLSAYAITTSATTVITTAPVATFALAADAVWFVGHQQQPGPGALLSRWDAGTQATTEAAWLPGFAIAGDGTACGRIHMTADGMSILYDSLFDANTAPCPNPVGPSMLAINSGTSWSLFATLPPLAAGGLRQFTLDPAGQWAAALDIAANGKLAAHVTPTNNTAPLATLPTITLAGAATDAPTLVQNMLAVTAAPQAADKTAVALVPTDGTAAVMTTLAGTDVAFAPPPSESVTTGTPAITCPATSTSTDATAARIAVIGDSLTQGYGTTLPTQCSFAAQLGALTTSLTLNRPANVLMRGMGGYRVDQMLTSIADLVTFTPDIAVIELGTNDERESWPLAQTQAAYDTILTTLQQAPGTHGAHPIIACLSIWPSPDFDAPEQLAPYNTLIAQACTRFGGTYVDITPLATTGMSDSANAPDFNWHPNDRGALNLARLIMSTLAATGVQLPA